MSPASGELPEDYRSKSDMNNDDPFDEGPLDRFMAGISVWILLALLFGMLVQ